MDELWLQLEAQIQGNVAEFLGLKTILYTIKNTPDLEYQTKVMSLIQEQVALETQLTNVMKTIDQVKQGQYPIMDIVSSTMTYKDMLDQIENVKAIQAQIMGDPKLSPSIISSIPMWAWLVGLAGVTYWAINKR